MGIRYYAYPRHPDHYEAAAEDPRSFMSDDPLGDAWGLVPNGDGTSTMGGKAVPPMLYLYKCWPHLQSLTTTPLGGHSPAHALFAGEPTMLNGGLCWEGFAKALSPAEMKEIAEDLKDATLFDDRDAFEPGVIEDMPSELHYAQHYLEKAKDFAQEMSDKGLGAVYLIA